MQFAGGTINPGPWSIAQNLICKVASWWLHTHLDSWCSLGSILSPCSGLFSALACMVWTFSNSDSWGDGWWHSHWEFILISIIYCKIIIFVRTGPGVHINENNTKFHWIKIKISDMQEICRIGQNFLNISFICMKCCPILY